MGISRNLATGGRPDGTDDGSRAGWATDYEVYRELERTGASETCWIGFTAGQH